MKVKFVRKCSFAGKHFDTLNVYDLDKEFVKEFVRANGKDGDKLFVEVKEKAEKADKAPAKEAKKEPAKAKAKKEEPKEPEADKEPAEESKGDDNAPAEEE